MLLVKNYESCQEEVLTSTSDPYPTEILQQNPCSDPDWTLIFFGSVSRSYLLTYLHTYLVACLLTRLHTYLHTKKFRASSTYLVTHLRRQAGV